ncbi:MAG: tripartite tricarboxylate transporter substrate binding protein [Betaproteobacteria bacterium]|nr:tripartite tricarboxylate transporter substrate binding protein [Betaproteobacteria bacterium]MBI2290572.1 tripartite tricarboxylate transporter substrate binding protein [Betaproteobacteria bacterium]MBI3053124.1 tripartite tricarboxylate transporter substrate binding protein [Betaproteobacteria bacterium]
MLIRLVLVALLVAAAPAHAQTYPAKSIRIVVPFAPGGGADIIARILGQKMTDSWGQQVVVDNRAGASGNIGAEIVAKAAPDGHTLLMASSALAINPSVYRSVPYDPIKDFAPITQPALLPNILVVHSSVPVKTVRDLIALAKSRPGQLAYASAGAGTGTHLAAEMFKLQAGVDMVHVPYKGGGAVISDLLGGQVALTFATLPSVMPYVKAGRLRALAMTTTKRWPGLPTVPTIAESGFPGFEISTWIGLLAPAGTPKDVVGKLHGEVTRILKLPDVRERFDSLGMEPVGDSPEQFARYIRSELAKYAKVVRQSGARVE